MEILVSKILDNPYRNFERNPLIDSRTEQLMESIGETGFWDNVVVRYSDTKGHFDLAYGHHRIEAVRQLGIKKVDVPVKDLSDAVMVKMMADENLMQWGNSPAATNEAIEGARDVLEWGLQASESAENFKSYTGVRLNKNAFCMLKGAPKIDASGTKIYPTPNVGSHIIQDFLGSNSWNLNTIVASLKVVNAERDAEKHAAAEQAACDEAAALEQVRREEDAKRKSEEAKVARATAAKAKAEADKKEAQQRKMKAASDAARAKAQKAADAAAERAREEKRKLDAANRARTAARKAAIKAEKDANKKRDAAVKAHAARDKVINTPNRDDFEKFPTQRQATTFTSEVQKYTMSGAERNNLVEYLVRSDTPARAIPTAIKNWVKTNTKVGRAKSSQAKQKTAYIKGVTLDDYVSRLNADLPAIIKQLKEIEPYIESIADPRITNLFTKRILEELTPVVNKVVIKLNALRTLKVV